MFATPPTYTPPRLVSRAASVVEPKGAGTVLVQVQVNADGSFKVLRVIRSSNAGDNAAALDIAAHSKYAPALRNGQPVKSLFDFNVKFGEEAVSGAAAQIASMLHNNNFNGAKAAAAAALAQSPDNHLVQAQLGVADAFLHDIPGAVAAFDQAGTIPSMYQNVAMQAYSLNAASIATTQPQTALVQAQKAVSMNGDYGAYYALGLAQHANKDYSAAVASLEKAESLAKSAHPPADAASMANIEQSLLAAAQSAGDKATVDRVTAEIGKLDPSAGGKSIAYTIDTQAADKVKLHDYSGAVAMYEKAAAASPQWAGPPEYTKAAIVLATEPLPNYGGARIEAEKAIALNANYAPAYYVDALAMAWDAQGSGNMDELQRSTDSANHAAALAQKAGDTQLAEAASYFAKNHQVNMNLQVWSTGLSTNPRYGTATGNFDPGSRM